MNNYKVLFTIGDRKLQMKVEAHNELDAFDRVKDKIVLVGVKKLAGFPDDFFEWLEKELDDLEDEEKAKHLMQARLRVTTPALAEKFKETWDKLMDCGFRDILESDIFKK